MMRTGVETMQWRNVNPHFQRMLLFFFFFPPHRYPRKKVRPLDLYQFSQNVQELDTHHFLQNTPDWREEKKSIYICWKISKSFRQDLISQISCSSFLSSWVGAACINPFIAKGSSPSCIQFPWGMMGHFILLRWWSGNSLLQLVQWLLASVFPSDYLCVSDLACLHVWLHYRCVGLAPSSSHRKLFCWGALRLEPAQLMSQALFALAAWCNERPLVFLSSLCFFSKVFCPCSSYHHTC